MSELKRLIEDTYFRLNPRIRCEHTRNQYRYALKDFEGALGREATLSDLCDDNVAAMMVAMQNELLAAKTINERRGRIHAFWTWMARRGELRTWPTTPRISEPERTPVAWLKDQLPTLFAAFERERVLIAGVPAPAWWKSIHYAFWDSGERVGALIQSRFDFLDGPWLLVPAEVRKGGRKDKAYRLEQDTLESINAIRQPTRELIWPWPFCRDYLWTRYRIIRRRVGLPTDRRSSFHRMRKTVASYYTKAGGDATELLDHSSRLVTKKYLDPRIVETPQAADLLFRPVPINSPGR
jgi:integrase